MLQMFTHSFPLHYSTRPKNPAGGVEYNIWLIFFSWLDLGLSINARHGEHFEFRVVKFLKKEEAIDSLILWIASIVHVA